MKLKESRNDFLSSVNCNVASPRRVECQSGIPVETEFASSNWAERNERGTIFFTDDSTHSSLGSIQVTEWKTNKKRERVN